MREVLHIFTLLFPLSGEYMQNLCNANDPSCTRCPDRLPSCVGVPDGDVGFPGRLWKPDYVTCYKNRTVLPTKTCTGGYFHPVLHVCTQDVNKSKIYRYTYMMLERRYKDVTLLDIGPSTIGQSTICW